MMKVDMTSTQTSPSVKRERFRFTVSPIYFPLAIFCYGALGYLLAQYYYDLISPGLVLSDDENLRFIASFVVFSLLLVLVHEMGHVLVGKHFKLSWKRLNLGFGASVWLTGRRTVVQQLFVSAGGSLLQITVAGLLLLTVAYPPLFLAALIAIVEGAFNLFVPLRHSDSFKFYYCLWQIIRGRGKSEFKGVGNR